MIKIEMIIAERDQIIIKRLFNQEIDCSHLRVLCQEFETDYQFNFEASDGIFFKSVCDFLNSYK